MSRYPDEDPDCLTSEGPLHLVIDPRPHDLGGFTVRRALPAREWQRVGPFIFFDHIGPAQFEPGKGVDVRPHPHIGLATVTYLFEGAFMHRDSLGSAQLIEPGAVNWMTAGRGIVHSERTPPDSRKQSSRLHGIQSWVALPIPDEETEASFEHCPTESLPVIRQGGVTMRLIAGSAYGKTSPVRTLSGMFYLDAKMHAGSSITLPADYEDRAVYPIDAPVSVNGVTCSAMRMAVLKSGGEVEISASVKARLMLLGGEPLEGERILWWNLVSSSRDLIEKAKQDWAGGRFPKVPGDEIEFIPLPVRKRARRHD
ncbi:MAG: pirin family protein [Gammaproteobacteria bacterium]